MLVPLEILIPVRNKDVAGGGAIVRVSLESFFKGFLWIVIEAKGHPAKDD